MCLAAPYYTLAAQRPVRLGYDGSLAFSMIVIVKVDDDPILRAAELMRPRRVRKQGREMPTGAARVQYRQPSLVCWVEAPRGNDRQAVCGCRLTVLAIDVEQYVHARFASGLWAACGADAPEHARKARSDRGEAARTHARQAGKRAVVRGNFHRLERIDVQLLMKAPRQRRADAWNGSEQGFGVG